MNPHAISIAAAGQLFAIVLKQAEDGWLAYPEGINGVVIGQGDTAAAALEDLRSAIRPSGVLRARYPASVPL